MKKNFFTKSILSLLVIGGIAFTNVSCEEAPKEKENTSNSSDEVSKYQEKFNSLMKENMEVHDEVMPKMTTLNSLLTTVEASDTMDEELQLELIAKMKDAHSHMMSWMKSLSANFTREEVKGKIATEDIEELKLKLAKLEESYKDAKEMSKKFNKSIEEAEAAIADLR